jgi:hypothetical protein
LPSLGATAKAVIVVQALAVARVAERILAGSVARRADQGVPVDVDDVTAELDAVAQRAPGKGVMALAKAEEAAECQHRVGDLARDLVDHEIVDRAEMSAVPIVDRRALDLVRRDQPCRLVDGDVVAPGVQLHRTRRAEAALLRQMALRLMRIGQVRRHAVSSGQTGTEEQADPPSGVPSAPLQDGQRPHGLGRARILRSDRGDEAEDERAGGAGGEDEGCDDHDATFRARP